MEVVFKHALRNYLNALASKQYVLHTDLLPNNLSK